MEYLTNKEDSHLTISLLVRRGSVIGMRQGYWEREEVDVQNLLKSNTSTNHKNPAELERSFYLKKIFAKT